MGVPVGYGEYLDYLEARRAEPPTVLLCRVGVSRLRIDQHVNGEQSSSLAQSPDEVSYGDEPAGGQGFCHARYERQVLLRAVYVRDASKVCRVERTLGQALVEVSTYSGDSCCV